MSPFYTGVVVTLVLVAAFFGATGIGIILFRREPPPPNNVVDLNEKRPRPANVIELDARRRR